MPLRLVWSKLEALGRYQNVLSQRDLDMCSMNLVRHEIPTMLIVRPIRQPARHLRSEKQEVERQVKDLA